MNQDILKILDKDTLKVLNEIFDEMLNNESDKHPNNSQVLEIYKPENQLSFKDSKFKSPIKLANAIIDLQNHIMVTNSVRLNCEILSKNEKKVLIEHLIELRGWINKYLVDCINYIKNLSNEDEYANKSKEELIEELKKLKGE